MGGWCEWPLVIWGEVNVTGPLLLGGGGVG